VEKTSFFDNFIDILTCPNKKFSIKKPAVCQIEKASILMQRQIILIKKYSFMLCQSNMQWATGRA